MSEQRYGVHDCPNGFYYLRDVTDHSVYIHRNYGYLYSPYKEDIELVSTLLNELADKVDEQQSTINELKSKLKEKEEEDEELRKENEKLREENNFLKQIREAFQIDVKNSRQMLKRGDKYE